MSGPQAQELRAALARALTERAGLSPRDVAARADLAREDPAFAETVVQALVTGGAWIVDDPDARRVRLEELDALPPLQELEDALDRRRGKPLALVEWLRVGRLYALIERDEKGAACFRELLARDEPLPLAMAVEVAEAASRAGARALALAGVDRVAETVLTRDPHAEPEGEDDILRDDPLGAGALLERARDIALRIGHAPRAVALARAATALYERLGRRHEARESLAGQARAQLAAGRGKRARQVAERWRQLAHDDGAALSEARALGLLAGELEQDGALRAAADLHREAAELLGEEGDPAGALMHSRRRALLLERAGSLDEARVTLTRARTFAQEAGDPGDALSVRLDVARLDLIAGRLGEALGAASEVRAEEAARGDSAGAAAAGSLLAEVLLHAGDEAGARAALLEAAPLVLAGGRDDDVAVARACRVRAELEVGSGRSLEAGLLLLDAARGFRRLEHMAEAAQCLLRRAELELAAGASEACRRELKRALELTATLEPRLELRMELVRARLTSDAGEADLLLREVVERGEEGDPGVRCAAAAALARALLARGDAAGARAALQPMLEELMKLRDALPEALRAGFRRSPWARLVLEAGAAAGATLAL